MPIEITTVRIPEQSKLTMIRFLGDLILYSVGVIDLYVHPLLRSLFCILWFPCLPVISLNHM
jgi:hypothetical protein